ncbi:ubiquitin-protein transferase [Aureococcus anophagefferens]|nr:ubiquitin-protein transferase [Aureococcus anophagefferens]
MVQGDEDGLDLTALRPVVVYEGFGDAPDGHPVVRALGRGRRSTTAASSSCSRRSKTAPMAASAPSGRRRTRPSASSARGPTRRTSRRATCFRLLPDYDPPDKVAHLLNIAIRECEGFGLQ